MQSVAMEMNQAETAFLVWRAPNEYDLRWFTPAVEVDLCGHATLASAHALWSHLGADREFELRFHTKSGTLIASLHDEGIRLDFPATPPDSAPLPDGLEAALGAKANWCGRTPFDYLLEIESESRLRALAPDIDAIGELPARGVMVTARSEGGEYDFVSRFFAPASGVREDHATGSAHCALSPYWSSKLGKTRLKGFQASPRGGFFTVELRDDRVQLFGEAVTILEGRLL